MKLLSRKSSIGGDTIYLTASKIAVALIGMINLMLLSRFRTLDEYGTYSQIIMVSDLVTTILMLGLPNSINYFLAKAETNEEKQRFMSIYITLSTILTLIIAICLFFSTPMIIKYFDNPAITAFAYVFAVYPWSQLMMNSLSNTFVVYGKANRLMLFNIANAVSVLLILLAAKLFGLTFKQYMAFYMAFMLLFGILAAGLIRKTIGVLKPLFSKTAVKNILTFSVPMGLASVVGTLNAELDKFVIGRFFTTEEYAIFANAAKELPVTILATSFTAVLLPKFVKLIKHGKNNGAVELWASAANLSFCFMALVAGGFIAFAPDIMSLLYSEKYVTAGGIAVFRIYSLILLFRAIYWGIILNATGKTKFVFYSSVITLALNFVLNILSCYVIGFIGPAVASLLVIAIMACVQLGFSCKLIGVKFSKILPWKQIAVYIAQTVLLAAVFSAVRYLLFADLSRNATIAISVSLGIVWTLIYIIINKKNIIANWHNLNSDKYCEEE